MSDIVAAPRVDVTGALSDMLRSVLLFLPKLLAFVAILVIGWLVARLVAKAVNAILERVGFDRVVERGGVKAALARSRYDASDILAKLVYYALLLFTLQLAFGVWGPNPVSDLIKGVIAWLPKAAVAIVIVVVAAAIAKAVKDLVGNALGGLSYGRTLANIASYFILGLGIIAALNQIGVATTVTTPILIAVLATVAGILIVGVGGGLVRPMQSRWEGWLNRAAEESQTIKEHAQAYNSGQRDATGALGTPTHPQQAQQAYPQQPAPAQQTQAFTPAAPAPQQYQSSEPTQVIPPAGPGSVPPRG